MLTDSYSAMLFNINHNTAAINVVAISLHVRRAMMLTMMKDG